MKPLPRHANTVLTTCMSVGTFNQFGSVNLAISGLITELIIYSKVFWSQALASTLVSTLKDVSEV